MNIDFGPIGFFGPIAAIIIVARYLRFRERTQLYEAMRSALERGQTIPPEFISELQSRRGRRYEGVSPSFGQEPLAERIAEVRYGPQRDLRRGILWLAVGLGLVCVRILRRPLQCGRRGGDLRHLRRLRRHSGLCGSGFSGAVVF